MRWVVFHFICIVFTLPAYSQDSTSKKYFEGIVEYDIKNESYLQGVPNAELNVRLGSRLKLYFKNGSYMREYLDDAGYTIRKIFFQKDSNMVYDYLPLSSPDTLYLLDPAEKTADSYIVETGEPEEVLGYICPAAIIKTKYTLSFLPDTGRSTSTYYFCTQLPVNPLWQKDMYIWKDVIKNYKSIAIKFIEDDPFFMKQTFTATKIIWQEVSEKIFEINPKLIQAHPSRL